MSKMIAVITCIIGAWNTIVNITLSNVLIITCSFDSENQCSYGDLRLVGSLLDTEGTVEMCQNGAWNSLCSKNWGYEETVIVCQQLQLPTTGKTDLFYH